MGEGTLWILKCCLGEVHHSQIAIRGLVRIMGDHLIRTRPPNEEPFD